MPTPIESMHIVAARLEPFNVPFAFVGGAVIALLVDHPHLTEIRPTKDVDVIVEVVTLVAMDGLEERLRAAGFQHDTSEDAPRCRWLLDGYRIDIMPLNSNWFPEALRLAEPKDLGGGRIAKVISPPLFLATKLEAFKDRGGRDFYGSHDLEDIITVLDGRAAIIEEVDASPASVRSFIAKEFRGMLSESDFIDAFPGHLSPLSGSRQRASLIMERVRAIAAFE